MINVVGASQDPEKVTPATIYNFTPDPKKAAEKQKPNNQVVSPIPSPSQTETKSTLQPLAGLASHAAKVVDLSAPITPMASPKPETVQPSTSSQPPKPKNPSKLWLLLGILVVLAIGVGTTLYLTQSNQDIRQQASEDLPADENLPIELVEPTIEPTTEPELVTDVPETGIASQAGGLAGLVDEPISLGDTAQLDEELDEDLGLDEELNNEADLLALESSTPTEAPTPIPTSELINTTTNCNESCLTDTNCQNLAHSCYQGTCRLTSNLTSESCLLASGGSQISADLADINRIYTPNASLTGDAPAAGPANWLLYGLSGFGLLMVGGLAILLL